MASVWVHDRKRLEKLKGLMSDVDACRHFDLLLEEWASRGGKFRRIDRMEALLFDRKGKLRCGMYVEVFSVPTLAERGQPKRVKA